MKSNRHYLFLIALHIAVQHGNLQVVQILLSNSNIDVYALNAKGMNPLHILASYGKDNSSAILESFKESISDFNLDQKDLKGNSGK